MSAEAAVGWAMIALVVFIFAIALIRIVTVALAAKSLVARVGKLPGHLPDLGQFEAPLSRLAAGSATVAPLLMRYRAAVARIEAVLAVWRRIAAQAGYTTHAAAATIRELS